MSKLGVGNSSAPDNLLGVGLMQRINVIDPKNSQKPPKVFLRTLFSTG